MHVMLASKLGYFSEEGLDVDASYVALGKLAMDALNGNSAEYVGIVDMNVAQTLFTHKDMAILCEFSEPIRGIKVLGRADKGVKSGKDLKGKKIAVFFGVNIHVFIQKYLQEQGIEQGQVEFVNFKPPDAAAAFISGAVDAVVTWEPLVYNIQQKVGDNVALLTEDSQAYWPYKLLLVTRQTRLVQNRDEARRVLRAMIKADEFIKREPEKAYGMLASHLQIAPEVMPGFCKEIHYEVRLTPRLLDMIRFETEWMPKNLPEFFKDKLPVTTDFRSLVADELKSLKPAACQIQ
ncbi:MAG TPA: NrtA/SsuA/CpmA family ABC transporter substrate-binding protein [Verrucomicrobiota bacterium]|nr:NrtA/SsuA/CpmA family ABC transporter substrate-binding protein [Verrucomicrobiota bacterium]